MDFLVMNLDGDMETLQVRSLAVQLRRSVAKSGFQGFKGFRVPAV